LLTEEGLHTNPVISKIGLLHTGSSDVSIGYLKASPKGNKLAAAVKSLAKYELFDFDNSTGKLSNFIELEATKRDALAYGIEFSSDGSKLYCSAGYVNEIYQFDLKEKTPEEIKKSRLIVGKTEGWTGALQLGSDGMIYVSPYAVKHLGCIKNPNKKGVDCGFEEKPFILKELLPPWACLLFYKLILKKPKILPRLLLKTKNP
jgi:hypothetical protein